MAREDERQTSNKAGLRSMGKKMDNSRHGFDEQPASRKVPGASGKEERLVAGRRQPGTEAVKRGKAAALDNTRKRIR
jgi:hypothetical protein